MRYLYLYTAKAMLKKRSFAIGILVLLTIATMLFSLLFNVSSDIRQSFAAYRNSQNIQDFSFLARADLNKRDIDAFFKQHPEVLPNHRARIMTYYNLIDDKSVTSAKRENVREDAMFAMENYVDVLPFRYASADTLAKKYQFHFESNYLKDIMQKVNGVQHAYRFTPYFPNHKINKPVLVSGRFPQKAGEIAMYPAYIKANHLKLGDPIFIRGTTYTIVGTFYDPNYIFPKIDLSSVFFESTKQSIVLSMPSDFFAIKNLDMECYLQAKFIHPPKDVMKAVRVIANDPQASYTLTYLENISIAGGLTTMLSSFDATSYGVLGAFTVISLLIVAFVVRKSIREDRKKLGVLKSLGYSTGSLSMSYLVYGVFAGLTSVLGFALAMLAKPKVEAAVKGYFILPGTVERFDWWLLAACFVVIAVLVGGLSVWMAYRVLRERPMALLNPTESDHVNAVTRWVTKLVARAPFETRFKYTLASRSLSKLISIILLTTLGGTIISAIFISSNFLPALAKNFAKYDYDYAVTYNNSLVQGDPNNGLQPGDTVMLDLKGTIDEVNGVRTLNNKSSDGEFLHVMGIDTMNTSYPIYDMKGRLIHTHSDGLIVTSSFLTQFKAKVGDIITITPKSKYDFRFQIPIVGLSSNFTDGPGVFLDRAYLNAKIGNMPNSYNVRLTKSTVGTDLETFIQNSKIVSVVSMADVKHNYKQMGSIAKYLIGVLEAFMALLTMTLIALLSNLVIEENANQISLLKVMGFRKAEINRMVINIYVPFILLAILISIPLSLGVMKAIFYSIFGGDNIAFPIKLSPLQMLLSALTIIVGYLLSLRLNRKMLNKIPMSVALKRE
jgi:ABC-type antimicrobial peptide transport system permease subunit